LPLIPLLMRLLASTLLIAIAALAGAMAWGALSNLWADYQDSPTSTYLLLGLPALAVCLAAVGATVRLWRKP